MIYISPYFYSSPFREKKPKPEEYFLADYLLAKSLGYEAPKELELAYDILFLEPESIIGWHRGTYKHALSHLHYFFQTRELYAEDVENTIEEYDLVGLYSEEQIYEECDKANLVNYDATYLN